MSANISSASPTDTDLVRQTLSGNRESFGLLVGRYQSLVCSLAYNACGDVARSEDVAQEAFVAAWRQLGELREPERFKSWLCGIARNLVLNRLRRDQRHDGRSEPLDEKVEFTDSRPDPHHAAATREEHALVWQALAGVPETYREALVLYYREQQSVKDVADALEISEDAVKQRLARGRALLREAMAAMVEATLTATRPGAAFTLAVLAVLPVTMSQAAAATSAAASGATMIKGSTAAKAAAAAGLSGVLLGPLLGLAGGVFGAYAGVKGSLARAGSDRERAYIWRLVRWIVILSLVYMGTLLWLVFSARTFLPERVFTYVILLVGQTLVCGLGTTFLSLWFTRRIKQIRAEDQATGVWKAPPVPAGYFQNGAGREYISPVRLLGLPLIHIKTGGAQNGEFERGVAKGWIAIGDVAVGVLFACGGMACGGIACGGLSAGVVSLGGMAIGLLALGGGGIGWIALGGLAVGWYAMGGAAFGWVAAFGGAAWAKLYALGGEASALHANDAIARAYFESNQLFTAGKWLMSHANWLLWLTLLPMMIAIVNSRRQKRAESAK